MTNHLVVETKNAIDAPVGFINLPVKRIDGKKGKSGLVCMVPVVSESVCMLVIQNEIGKAWLTDQIDTVRHEIISKLYKEGKTIESSLFGIDAILAYMKSSTESQRMTKEAIGVWFDTDLAMLIAERIKEKMTGISTDKVKVLVDGYKTKFMSLSGRDVSMPDAIKAQLVKAISLLPDDYESVIGEKVIEALDKVTEASETLTAL